MELKGFVKEYQTALKENGIEVNYEDARLQYDLMGELVYELIKNGEKKIPFGKGAFELKHRAARKGRNPQNGDEIEIAASNNIAYSLTPKHKKEFNK